jgi:hypothetical protein
MHCWQHGLTPATTTQRQISTRSASQPPCPAISTRPSSHTISLYTNARQLFLFKARISARPIQRLQCQRHTLPPACPTSPPASSSATRSPRTSTPSRPLHPLATPGGRRRARSPPAPRRTSPSSSATLSRSWSAPPHTPAKQTSKLTSVLGGGAGKPEDPQAVRPAPRAGLPRHPRLTAGRAHPAPLPNTPGLPAQPPVVRAPRQALRGPRRLRAHRHAPPAPRRLRQEEVVSARQPARPGLRARGQPPAL